MEDYNLKNAQVIIELLQNLSVEEKVLIDQLQALQKKKNLYLQVLNEIMSIPCCCGNKKYPTYSCEAMTVYKCEACNETETLVK